MSNRQETLKANKQERALYKKMKRAISLANQVLENKHYGRHNISIAFNCKVYAWFRECDLEKVIESRNLSAYNENLVRAEFTPSRLENLYNHILNEEAQFFTECWIPGRSFNSPVYINEWKYLCVQNWPQKPGTGHPDLDKILTKKKSAKSACKAITEYFKVDLEGWKYIQYIDHDDVFQFGRSGGWMSISKASDFEEICDRIEDTLEEAFISDGLISIKNSRSRKAWWSEITNYWNCSNEQLDVVIARCEAVLWVLSQGRAMVKTISQEYLLKELERAVDELLSGILIKITPDQLLQWMEGKIVIRTNRLGNSYLRINPKDHNNIQTSQGVNIAVLEGKELFKQLQRYLQKPHERFSIFPGMRIGNFELESFTKIEGEYFLKAGCHNIPWSHIEEFATNYLFKTPSKQES